MAESDPILGSDILDPKTTANALDQVDQLVAKFNDLGAAMKIVASNSGKFGRMANPTDTAGLNQHTEAVKQSTTAAKVKLDIDGKLLEIEKKKIDLQNQVLQAQREYRAESKQAIADQTSEEGSVLRMQAAYNNLIQQYDRVGAATRTQMLPAIQKLKVELEGAKQATGRFAGAVGDYHDNTIKYAKGLRGLGGIGRLAARIFGFDQESFLMIQEAGRALKEYHHTQEAAKVAVEANTAATEANTIAIHENIVAEEEESVAKKSSLGWWALLAVAITAGAIAIYEWTKGLVVDTKEWERNNSTIKDSIKERKKLREELEKTALKQSESRGYLSDKDVKVLDLIADQDKKKAELQEKLAYEERKIRGKLTKDEEDELKEKNKKEFEEYENFNDALKRAYVDDDKEEAARLEAERDKRSAIMKKELRDQYNLIKQNTTGQIDSEQNKAERPDGDDEKRRAEIMQDGRLKDIAEEKIRYDDELKHAKEHGENIELVEELHRKKLLDIDKKYFDEAVKLADEYTERESKKIEEENKKKVKEEKDSWEAAIKLADEYSQRESKIVADELKKRLKAEEDAAKAKKDIMDADFSAAQEIVKAENDVKQQALKTQTETLSTKASVQETLAAAGKKNSLDATLAAQTKAAEQEKQLQKKAQKEQEILSLSKLFIDAESAFLKAGSSPTEAIEKAIEQVALTKGISAGLAAAFFHGTADTGGPGSIDNKGGKLAILHPHEAVIPKARNEEMPGLAKAWIDGDIDNYLAQMYMPQLIIDDKKLTDENVSEKIITGIVSGIKEAIENQPVKTTYQNGNDTVIEEDRGGRRTTRIIKNENIIPRRR